MEKKKGKETISHKTVNLLPAFFQTVPSSRKNMYICQVNSSIFLEGVEIDAISLGYILRRSGNWCNFFGGQIHLNLKYIGVLLWCSGLRIQHRHCNVSGLIPGLRISTCHEHGQKQKQKQRNTLICTRRYTEWLANGDLPYSTENSTYEAKQSERECMCVHV